MKKSDYLERILKARVYDVAIESPLELAPTLSRRLGNRVLLKREDQQPVFSFKLRGAYNKMSRLAPAKLKKGVITASAGNHAQGVALAAQKLGCRAVILMRGVVTGMTITARQPRRCAASATPCAWLPALAAITPFFRRAAGSFDIML